VEFINLYQFGTYEERVGRTDGRLANYESIYILLGKKTENSLQHFTSVIAMICSTDMHGALLTEYLSAVALVIWKTRSYSLYGIVCVRNRVQSINIMYYLAFCISQLVAVAQFV